MLCTLTAVRQSVGLLHKEPTGMEKAEAELLSGRKWSLIVAAAAAAVPGEEGHEQRSRSVEAAVDAGDEEVDADAAKGRLDDQREDGQVGRSGHLFPAEE